MTSFIFKEFKDLKLVDRPKSFKIRRIHSIIRKYKGDKRLTLKIIPTLYFDRYSEHINLMSISRIHKTELEACYRKTNIKSPKLCESKYILMTLVFLKSNFPNH